MAAFLFLPRRLRPVPRHELQLNGSLLRLGSEGEKSLLEEVQHGHFFFVQLEDAGFDLGEGAGQGEGAGVGESARGGGGRGAWREKREG